MQGIGTEEAEAFSPLLEDLVCCASWPATPFVQMYAWFPNRCTLVLVMVNAHALALQVKVVTLSMLLVVAGASRIVNFLVSLALCLLMTTQHLSIPFVSHFDRD